MSDRLVTLTYDGAVAVVSLNRPSKHNAFTDEMDDQLFAALGSIAERDDVRAVVWRGEGASFSSGRDTQQLGVRAHGESDLEYIERGHERTKRLLLECPVPIVVALKGWVLGGSFERALLCDIRIAAEDARMGLPEVEYGVIPDSGGTARLAQIAGHGFALDLALTGRIVDAAEALRHGIVTRVVPNASLDETAVELARLIASRSPRAVRAAREIVHHLTHPDVVTSMDEEKHAQAAIFASDDYRELKAARAENRPPDFTGT